jgi:hypothetical protein
MSHAADESKNEIFVHGWLPCIGAGIVLAISIVVDLKSPGMHWAQRSGSVITVLGAYVAYRDAKRSIKIIGHDLFMNPHLLYRPISMALVAIGTVVWGYADWVL